MSRVGQKAVPIPAGVAASVQQQMLTVKGPKESLSMRIPEAVTVEVAAGRIEVRRREGVETASAIQGLVRTLAANMIEGVTRGYAKQLEIQGVGFKAAVQGESLALSLGYSKPVLVAIPRGLTVKVGENVNIAISGADKQLVGDFAARVRALFPAEPYKGKGVRYKGEHVRHKVGKTVA
jgi:large subunit ribosomal protein L6